MVERFYVNFVNCIHTAPDVGFHIISLYWMDCRVKVFSLLFVGKRLKMNGIFDFFNIFNAREMITNRTERKIFFKNKFCCCHSPLVVSWSLCVYFNLVTMTLNGLNGPLCMPLMCHHSCHQYLYSDILKFVLMCALVYVCLRLDGHSFHISR